MDSYLATILPVAFSYAPDGWLGCWGQQISISQYNAIYSLVSNIYGGDGRTYFNLPDLRGRMPIGYGQRLGSSHAYNIGNKGGEDDVVLGYNQLPVHTHGATFTPTGRATVNIPAQSGSQKATLKVLPTAGTAQLPVDGSVLSGGGTVATKIYGSSSTTMVSLDSSSVALSGNAPTAAQSVSTDAITGGAVLIQPAGNSQPVDLRNPYLAINFIFCVQGLYPIRP
ncbi:microcystin-dependent protein [Agrobacterium vitis]|nr:microcystin-dependent protein [Agrobacterium vitis]MBE1440201.1 microcystin-dependent protein [Agrobacterium vitis]